ncbi:MAG TPA: response regulator, partial [Polyangiales bacterium]|nr:response regulator [Polyangiales bacterium]
MIANSAQALRLLIVDDEELDRQAVVRAVRGLVPAPTFLEARSISEAERRLAEGTFDCVVLDYRLPEGPCTEFLAGMQARAPGTAFVVLTGQGDESIAVELMKAGAADYLSKENFDPTRVRHAVKYAVALHRAEEQAAEAEARRRHYAQRLQRFVEHAPALVAARSLQELAHATADVALEVLEAREAYVVLRHAGVEYLASRGQSE